MSDKSSMIEEKLRILEGQIDILDGLLDTSAGVGSKDEESEPESVDRPIATLIEKLPEDLGFLQDRLFKTCARFESLFISDGSTGFAEPNTTDIGGSVGKEVGKIH